MKKKRKVLKIVLIILVVFVVGFGAFMFIGLNTKNAAIANVDITKVPDGAYHGSYSAGRFSNKVEVVVSGGRITDIRVVKDVTFALPEVTQKLISSVLTGQTLGVDTVSGATATTKAYLLAIEDALKGK